MSDLVDLKDLLDGMVGDDLGYDETEWAVYEIEQLREWRGQAVRSMDKACVSAGAMCCDLIPEAVDKLRVCTDERLQRESNAWRKLANRRQDRIKELEGQLTACRMYSRTLEVSGSKAMDKIEELKENVRFDDEHNILISRSLYGRMCECLKESEQMLKEWEKRVEILNTPPIMGDHSE